jgi:hypothetical protein
MGAARVIGTRLVACRRWKGAHAATLGLALVLGLTACGDSQPDATAPSATSKKGDADRKGGSGVGDADMVSAFSATRGQPGLVDLKFKLTKRPGVGEPVEIEFAMIPAVELERLFARFQAAEGLQIVSGAESQHFEHPTKGSLVSHKLTVTAKTDGIYYVTAIVLADSDNESVARTFAIPLIAGQGLTELPSSPPSASVADPKSAPARP